MPLTPLAMIFPEAPGGVFILSNDVSAVAAGAAEKETDRLHGKVGPWGNARPEPFTTSSFWERKTVEESGASTRLSSLAYCCWRLEEERRRQLLVLLETTGAWLSAGVAGVWAGTWTWWTGGSSTVSREGSSEVGEGSVSIVHEMSRRLVSVHEFSRGRSRHFLTLPWGEKLCCGHQPGVFRKHATHGRKHAHRKHNQKRNTHKQGKGRLFLILKGTRNMTEHQTDSCCHLKINTLK